MKGFLSMAAGMCVAALIGLLILPGPLSHGLPVGIGSHGVLVPAGDDGPGGH